MDQEPRQSEETPDGTDLSPELARVGLDEAKEKFETGDHRTAYYIACATLRSIEDGKLYVADQEVLGDIVHDLDRVALHAYSELDSDQKRACIEEWSIVPSIIRLRDDKSAQARQN